MKYISFIFFIISITLYSSATIADNLIYCKSKFAAGFMKHNGSWEAMLFEKDKFKLKFKSNYSKLEGFPWMRNPMFCSKPFSHKPNLIFCVNSSGSHEVFIYNKITRRFTFSNISSDGYTYDGIDTDQIYAGICEKL